MNRQAFQLVGLVKKTAGDDTGRCSTSGVVTHTLRLDFWFDWIDT